MPFKVGDRVNVDGFDGVEGTVKYVGPLKHGDNVGKPRVGVELDKPVGKNNGKVQGQEYWSGGKTKHGVLVTNKKLSKAAVTGGEVVAASGSSMDIKTIFKYLKSYYEKHAPNSKTPEQIQKVADKIKAKGHGAVNDAMNKKYGETFDDHIKAVKAARKSKKKKSAAVIEVKTSSEGFMSESKIFKNLKAYYKKYAPDAKTVEELEALAKRIHTRGNFEKVNAPMLKKYGQDFESFCAEKASKQASKKSSKKGKGSPAVSEEKEIDKQAEESIQDLPVTMSEEDVKEHLRGFFEKHAPNTKTDESLAKMALKIVLPGGAAKAAATQKKKYDETLEEYLQGMNLSLYTGAEAVVPEPIPEPESEHETNLEEKAAQEEEAPVQEEEAPVQEEEAPVQEEETEPVGFGGDEEAEEQPAEEDEEATGFAAGAEDEEEEEKPAAFRKEDTSIAAGAMGTSLFALPKEEPEEFVVVNEPPPKAKKLSSAELNMGADELRDQLLTMKQEQAMEASKGLYNAIENLGSDITVKTAQSFMAKGASFTAYRDKGTGGTALHELATWDISRILELAIADAADGNTDLNIVNKDKESALWYACQFGSSKCAKLLVDAGVITDNKDKRGRTPLDIAVQNSQSDIIELLGGTAPARPQSETFESFGFGENDEDEEATGFDSASEFTSASPTPYESMTSKTGDFVNPHQIEKEPALFPVTQSNDFFGGFEDRKEEDYVPVTPFDWGPQ